MAVSEPLANIIKNMVKRKAFVNEKTRQLMMETVQHNVDHHSCFRCVNASFFCDSGSAETRGWRIEVAGCKKMLAFNSKADDGYSRNLPIFCSEENQSDGLSSGTGDNSDNLERAVMRVGEETLEKLIDSDRPRP